jgi:hypothetical protein
LGKRVSTEKLKQPKAVVAAHGDMSTSYAGREKFCSECGSKTHAAAKCWILHPEMRPTGQAKPRDRSKATKNVGAKSEHEQNKPTDRREKANKHSERLKTIEAQLATLVSSLKVNNSSARSEETSFHGDVDDRFCGFSEPNRQALVSTRAQTQVDVPRGADSVLDPQMGEARRQVRLPGSFVLEDVPAPNPISLQRRSRGRSLPTVPITAPTSIATNVTPMVEALLQVPLFSAQQLTSFEVDVASIFDRATTLCKPQGQGPTTVVAMGEMGDSDEEEASSDMDVYAAISRVKTMPRRPAIERSSITPGVVMVDNRNDVVQLVGPTGQVFTPPRVLLDSGAQPLCWDEQPSKG